MRTGQGRKEESSSFQSSLILVQEAEWPVKTFSFSSPPGSFLSSPSQCPQKITALQSFSWGFVMYLSEPASLLSSPRARLLTRGQGSRRGMNGSALCQECPVAHARPTSECNSSCSGGFSVSSDPPPTDSVPSARTGLDLQATLQQWDRSWWERPQSPNPGHSLNYSGGPSCKEPTLWPSFSLLPPPDSWDHLPKKLEVPHSLSQALFSAINTNPLKRSQLMPHFTGEEPGYVCLTWARRVTHPACPQGQWSLGMQPQPAFTELAGTELRPGSWNISGLRKRRLDHREHPMGSACLSSTLNPSL